MENDGIKLILPRTLTDTENEYTKTHTKKLVKNQIPNSRKYILNKWLHFEN